MPFFFPFLFLLQTEKTSPISIKGCTGLRLNTQYLIWRIFLLLSWPFLFSLAHSSFLAMPPVCWTSSYPSAFVLALCLEHRSPATCPLLPPSSLCSNVISSRPSLTHLFKIATCGVGCVSPVSFPCIIFLYSTNHFISHLLMCLLSLSSTRKWALWGCGFYLLCCVCRTKTGA